MNGDSQADHTAASPDRGRGAAARVRAGLRQTAGVLLRRSGPWLAGAGRWLVGLGWGKFCLLGLLLLIVASVAQEVFDLGGSSDQAAPRVPVVVEVAMDDKGLHITGPQGTTDSEPQIHIDDQGVHVQTEKNGQRKSVVIDRHGVRVEAGPAPPAAGKTPEVTLPPAALADPDKVADAVDAAKDRIEQIVQHQIDRKLSALPAARATRNGLPDLAELAVLLVFTLMMVKVALSSKRRAESRAQAADAVAAEEGLKRQLAEARLTTMQAQVEPHFLFNTLASVDYLIETDPARASKMQKNLIQYLRTALPQMRQTSSTLGQEMSLCRAYLEILKVRMEERLHYAIMLPAGLATASFPPMMLQSLVENSIKHGLEPKPEGGTMTLSADVVDGNLRVSVSDSGLGFGVAGLDGGGVGLSNIRERLQALFGPAGHLSLEANVPSGTIATVQVPYRAAAPAAAPPPVAPQPA